MHNIAIVNRVEGNNFFLVHIKDYDKKEKTERDFWKIKNQEFQSLNPENLNLLEGEAVEYYIPEGKTIVASFTILILPLITFLLSFGILKLIGLESEKLISLISISLMLASFSFNKLLKKIGIKETLPVITKKITKDNLKVIQSECKDCGSCTACN
ncbi:hypothetical protein EW093_08930 [Thiospirochaeta perfilievii]|uniref:SoxR reducing system RseC family protein n=1 Tax=Thiospirochaeta perfilievii TaxID=252967 RepID=A0A5C1QBC2_9SPIO|nr:SoxR reducing system RseC family protein [Thiospirochaeta perfilievii]QEN04821.1 hypothetical protein EW093_08930 [Thiospirochaeta perfilievii]